MSAVRDVVDTSRQGRYHNAVFASAAHEVGLDVEAAPPFGLALTTVPEEARGRYRAAIGRRSPSRG